MTVQLALISDGRRSFGLVFYKVGAMRWAAMENEALIIGFSNGQRGEEVVNFYSNTTEAFTQLDRIKGNTGRSTASVLVTVTPVFLGWHLVRRPGDVCGSIQGRT